MRAFQDIRAEMREAVVTVTHPYAAKPRSPMQRTNEEPEDDEDEGHIEPWMAASFHELIRARETDAPFALVSCFMNGEPAAVIALAHRRGEKTHITPLFLACQAWMKFSSERSESGGGEEGGGPERTDPGDSPAPR